MDSIGKSFTTTRGFGYNVALCKYQDAMYETYKYAGIDAIDRFICVVDAPTNPYPDVIHSYHIPNGSNYIVAVFCTCARCNGAVVHIYMIPNAQIKMFTTLDDFAGYQIHAVGRCNCHN
jgi:hypothetical protein